MSSVLPEELLFDTEGGLGVQQAGEAFSPGAMTTKHLFGQGVFVSGCCGAGWVRRA